MHFASELRHRAILGAIVLTVAGVVFVAWASLAPLSGAVIAPAIVVPNSRAKTVQHLDGGIIREILATDGAIVDAGQELLVLDDTRPRIAFALLLTQYRAVLASHARLVAERDGHPQIVFPTDLLQASDAPEVRDILAAETDRFTIRRDALAGETGILRQRSVQLEEEIIGLQAQRKSTDAQLTLLQDEISIVQQLVDAGHERKPRLLALFRAAHQIEGERGLYAAQIAKARQGISEARLRASQLDIVRLREVADELKDVQILVLDFKERLQASEDVLRRTRVRSPQAGTVVRMNYFTIGGVIPAGGTIMDIVPRDERPVVEARVRPEDIESVRRGMTVQVWPTAFNTRYLPPLLGWVSDVSADRLTEKNAGRSYYLCRIEVDPGSAGALPSGIDSLVPGMPAEAIIETQPRKLLSYLFLPLTGAIRRAFREP